MLDSHLEWGSLQGKANLLTLKQGLTLTGLGIPAFDLAVQGMRIIQQGFVVHLGDEKVRDWEVRKDGDNLALAFNNRLLTHPRDAHGEEILDMSSIDPLKVLQGRLKSEMYTSDNVVEYWQCQSQKRYIMNPNAPARL